MRNIIFKSQGVGLEGMENAADKKGDNLTVLQMSLSRYDAVKILQSLIGQLGLIEDFGSGKDTTFGLMIFGYLDVLGEEKEGGGPMRIFEKFNPAKECPVCKKKDQTPCVLIPIPATTEDDVCEAIQVHTKCLDLQGVFYKDNIVIGTQMIRVN